MTNASASVESPPQLLPALPAVKRTSSATGPVSGYWQNAVNCSTRSRCARAIREAIAGSDHRCTPTSHGRGASLEKCQHSHVVHPAVIRSLNRSYIPDMRPDRVAVAPTAAWDIARPARMTLPGVVMAGFSYRGDGPLDLRAIPHPAITVNIEFGDCALDVHDAAGRRLSGSMAAGLLPSPIDARVQALDCVQIRLSPLVAPAVLGIPPTELSGSVIALDDLWGREASRIQERLHHTRTWPKRFALIHTALSRRLQTDRGVDPEVAVAWRHIIATHGRIRVGDLAAHSGWSRQHLWSRFAAQIGVTPKGAISLVRFDHAMHRLVSGQSPAQVAIDSGYADQSHLHRDVRAFTAATPRTSAGEPWLAVDDTAWPTGSGTA